VPHHVVPHQGAEQPGDKLQVRGDHPLGSNATLNVADIDGEIDVLLKPPPLCHKLGKDALALTRR
jgi:hypothetical protein